MKSKAFVFVVCGAKEHITALHFSINALKRFSQHSIIVVTDSIRNEVQVVHDSIINIKTDSRFSNHQSSIFLKTNLHRLLPDDAHYCYLDTDVVAINNQVDSIFNHFFGPITFSQDYCTINEFSSFAIKCNCLENFKKANTVFLNASEEYEQTLGKEYRRVLQEINAATETNKQSKILRIKNKLKYKASKEYYSLNEKYKLNKKTKKWLNSAGEDLEEKYTKEKFIQRETGFIWNEKKGDFFSNEGLCVTRLKCSHLREQIKTDFNIEIEKRSWKHWNGGVFLFNQQSHAFMDYWHKITVQIFDNPSWKTRDQGTLAATVWKMGLQNHKTLDKKYNFIIDYNSKELKYLNNLTFQDNFRICKPFFLHIFHHFGDKNWTIWQDVEQQVSSETAINTSHP